MFENIDKKSFTTIFLSYGEKTAIRHAIKQHSRTTVELWTCQARALRNKRV